MDKSKAVRRLKHPYIAVGDGTNGIGMMVAADLGIAFGGIRGFSEDIRNAEDVVVNC